MSGFGHAFRFCPGGKHVEYRQGSRTAHQGNINFISVDSHKGAGERQLFIVIFTLSSTESKSSLHVYGCVAGPSRRSDLQSLGYCMLCWMTGSLPWSHLSQISSIATEKEK